ncbi:hypothetical protein KOI35_25815 [Actinoplanes bogorensis]|uniref:Uncharacterized protein n=1 Tax=Paractinoplanes bogorensis TaxID=1610840 RepID=A0ABS5YW41_9ACTN|nr:hypothetical protein [Actinoplanes bogorensis]MBU2666934.1 hypothetical protein [Actinoplanes bogorensis]
MTLNGVLVDSAIRARLGDGCLDELCAYLWAEDCQTCTRPFGDERPSLSFVGVHGYADSAAMASLHHERCRGSDWATDYPADSASVSFVVQPLLLPDEMLGGSDETTRRHGVGRPAMLVNPGMETAPIAREDGEWHVRHGQHRYLGMRGFTDGYVAGRPVTAGRVVLSHGDVIAHLGSSSWSCRATDTHGDAVRRYGGVTLLLTHAFGGGLRDEWDLLRILPSPDLEAGWLALRGR